MEIGSLKEAIKISINYCRYAFLSGQRLNTLLCHIKKFKDSSSQEIISIMAIYQCALNLINKKENNNPYILSGEIFDSISFFDRKDQSPIDIIGTLIPCLVLAYIFNDYPSAVSFANRCKPYLMHIESSFMYSIYLLYGSLAFLALDTQTLTKKELMSNVEENLLKLKILSKNAPECYENKVRFLEAEIAAVNGSDLEALKIYEESIHLSETHDFPHEEAIANERAGLLLLKQNPVQSCDFFLNSCKCYESWGAIAKKDELVAKYSLRSNVSRSIFSHLDSYSGRYVQLEENRSNASISQLTDSADGSQMMLPDFKI